MAPATKMFRKRYLIPLWLVQLILLGIYFVSCCVSLAIIGTNQDYLDDLDVADDNANTVAVLKAGFGVILAFIIFCILLLAIEIGLAASHKLKPTLHLAFACVRAAIAAAWSIISVIGSANLGRGYAFQLILAIALLLSTVAQVVYGSVLVHRERKGVYNGFAGNVDDSNSRNDGHGQVRYKGVGNDVEMGAHGPTYR